jgi:hypothetical protein
MGKGLSTSAVNQLRQAVRGDERLRRDRGGVRWDGPLSGFAADHFVITNCSTGIAGVVGVTRSTAPGSTTAEDGAEEEYAWLGTDGFAMSGDAVDCMPYAGRVGDTDVPWRVLDFVKGAEHWAEPASGDLSSTQDNPSAATLCDG